MNINKATFMRFATRQIFGRIGAIITAGFILTCVAVNSGCSNINENDPNYVDVKSLDLHNDHLNPIDLVNHLTKNDVKVSKIQLLNPTVLSANEALAVEIAGLDIGVYKYNYNVPRQGRALKRIQTEKCVYVMGLKYPVEVFGVFVILGLDKNPEQEKIKAALKTF